MGKLANVVKDRICLCCKKTVEQENARLLREVELKTSILE